MASPTQWTWVWVNSGSWWWTGRPGVLQFMGSQRVGHDWEMELELELKRDASSPVLSLLTLLSFLIHFLHGYWSSNLFLLNLPRKKTFLHPTYLFQNFYWLLAPSVYCEGVSFFSHLGISFSLTFLARRSSHRWGQGALAMNRWVIIYWSLKESKLILCNRFPLTNVHLRQFLIQTQSISYAHIGLFTP